jgi:hypothetical protein
MIYQPRHVIYHWKEHEKWDGIVYSPSPIAYKMAENRHLEKINKK